MKTKRILACVAMAVLLKSTADGADTYYKSSTPRYFVEWCTSDDGKVSASFAAEKTTFGTNETIRLRCAIRNDGGKPITVLRPFGDGFRTLSTGLSIMGPDGLIPYQGIMLDYILAAASFIELGPNMVAEDGFELLLDPDNFSGLGTAGLYVIGNEYVSYGYPKQPAPDNFWNGKVKMRSVTILIKETAPNKSVDHYGSPAADGG